MCSKGHGKLSRRNAEYSTNRKYLEERGWECSPYEPGLFRKTVEVDGKKEELILAVYVDDNIISGSCPRLIKEEMDAILKQFPGKEIFPEKDATGELVRDLLGAVLRYDHKARKMSITMRGAIEKLLTKFNMQDAKPVATPCVREAHDKKDSPKNDKFPFRQLVGSLLYIASIARPDISYAVQKVATQCENVTDAAVTEAKRILRYLKGTLDLGLSYSPEKEASFKSIYQKMAQQGGKEYKDTIAFCDADFAGCTVSLKSTSGCILYHRGVPVVWKSKKQGIRATSTMEAEYCAMYDCVRLSEEQGYLKWYLENESANFPLVFNDNKSALALSETSVSTKRSKHMHLRLHMIRDYVKDLCYCNTDINLADTFTKPLSHEKYVGLFEPHKFAINLADTFTKPLSHEKYVGLFEPHKFAIKSEVKAEYVNACFIRG